MLTSRSPADEAEQPAPRVKRVLMSRTGSPSRTRQSRTKTKALKTREKELKDEKDRVWAAVHLLILIVPTSHPFGCRVGAGALG